MISHVEKLGRSLAERVTNHLDWMDRRARAKHQAALKDRRTLEICFVFCGILFVMAWWSGKVLVLAKPILALAAIIVGLKLIQLALLALSQPRETPDE